MALSNITLLVGDSGSGKSSLIGTFAEWVWETHQKVTLLYSSDGGGFPTKISALARAGIVRVWKVRTRGDAFSTCQKAARGFWPVEFTDIEAGETPPHVNLVAPMEKKYSLFCTSCGVEAATRKSRKAFPPTIKCPGCGKVVSRNTGVFKETLEKHPVFEQVGAVAVDGITSMQNWIMEEMARMAADGTLKGEVTNIGGKIVTEDGEYFGANNRSHYGFAQVRAESWMHEIGNIPNLVVGPVVTARELKATDSDSKLPIYGPAIAGKAKAADVPSWVGHCLGTVVVPDGKGRNEWRLYLSEYREEDGVKHLCKTRCAPGTLPLFLSDGPVDSETNKPITGDEAFTKFNLGYFMKLVEESTQASLDETKKKYPDAPGLDYLKAIPAEDKEVKTPVETNDRPKPAATAPPRPGGNAVPRPKAARPIPRPKPKQ